MIQFDWIVWPCCFYLSIKLCSHMWHYFLALEIWRTAEIRARPENFHFQRWFALWGRCKVRWVGGGQISKGRFMKLCILWLMFTLYHNHKVNIIQLTNTSCSNVSHLRNTNGLLGKKAEGHGTSNQKAWKKHLTSKKKKKKMKTMLFIVFKAMHIKNVWS